VDLSKLRRPFISTGLVAILFFVSLSLLAKKASPQIMNPETKGGFNVLVTAYLKKMVYYLYSNQPDDVLVLGSSVVLNPSCQTDIRYELRPPSITWLDYNRFMEDYVEARGFEHSLRDVFGQQLSAANLALPSAVMEDNAFLLKKLIEMHRKPAMIVLGLSPRDFLVNLTGSQGPTITQEVLETFKPLPLPTAYLGDYPAETMKSAFALYQFFTPDSMGEQRNLLKKSLREIFAISFLQMKWLVTKGNWLPVADDTRFFMADGFIDAPATFADLKYFPNIYSDLTRPYLEKQLLSFEQLLKAAQEADIPVFVASMPMSAPNKALFKGNTASRYESAVHSLIDKYGATLWVADQDGTWPLKYFHDSVHLNAAGGHLFFNRLAQALRENATIAQRLTKNAGGLKVSAAGQTH
jgi:hypothetical protein